MSAARLFAELRTMPLQRKISGRNRKTEALSRVICADEDRQLAVITVPPEDETRRAPSAMLSACPTIVRRVRPMSSIQFLPT